MGLRVNPNDVYIAFRTDKAMSDELKKLAVANRCNVSQIIRKLLYSVLSSEEGENNENK